ncbi:hypothetical protein ACWC9T_15905 [Kitasatospora sp. NPDC001159]
MKIATAESLRWLSELEATAGELMNRHPSREWFPHQCVPWTLGRDFDGPLGRAARPPWPPPPAAVSWLSLRCRRSGDVADREGRARAPRAGPALIRSIRGGAIRKALKELTDAGFYRVETIRMSDGTVRTENDVYDTPWLRAPVATRPASGEPAAGRADLPVVKKPDQETSLRRGAGIVAVSV